MMADIKEGEVGMMEREKIANRLEYCASNKCDICQQEEGSGFPWIDGRCYGFTERLYDAIALLKTQEPVKPMLGLWDRDIQLYKCGACGGEIGAGGMAKYCFHCGRKVLWK